jgi:DNA-binding response OmpR family regulator
VKNETAENGDAELDLSHFRPTFTGPEGKARLERKEAEILCYLIEREQRIVSKEELLNIWEEDEIPELDTIKSYISKIKRKLGTCFPEESGLMIKTKWGQGYQWCCEIHTKIIEIL